ncbi:retron St85 family effector protein [Tardiphaga sp.]|uniref:retron St85 family effector protein n=1 Tax=Tardiphaga sp. TaxID=1926292 RepID=UPI00352B7199
MDPNGIHVQAASNIIFLCGGQRSDLSVPTPLSLRDAFLKVVDNPILKNRDLVQAEDITEAFSFFDIYADILEFEIDIAQIVELIILFSESEGSLAELGAFAMTEEIAAHLFVIVREKHWKKSSFVRLGPLRRIEGRHGRGAIFIVEDKVVGMQGDSAAKVDKNLLVDLLKKPISERLAKPSEPSTFDASRSGHVIKLVVGLVQEYGALQIAEILELLKIIGVGKTEQDVRRYLLCAEAIGWVVQISKGTCDYYVAKANKSDAATILSKKEAEIRNKQRRRIAIREYWEREDPQRHRAMLEGARGISI